MKVWIKKAGIRAIKTIAQTAVAMIPVAVAINEIDWITVLSTSLTAGILSLLTSVAGLPELRDNTESSVEDTEVFEDDGM